MSQGYVGFRKQKKSGLGTTLAVVAAIHLVIGGGLVWLAHTQVGQEWLKIYKIKISQVKEKPPEPPPPPEPEPPKPEPPKPEPKAEAPPPPPAPVEAPKSQELVKAAPPVSLPGFGNPFGTGRRSRFAGYVDLVTSEIQKQYKQPPDLVPEIEYIVLCQLRIDENGRVLTYQLVNSSGNKEFDQSALEALAAVRQLRPPPPGMSPVIVVKFYPPS
jgi:protein TonB